MEQGREFSKRESSKGGQTTVKIHGVDHMRKIGLRGLRSRWKRNKGRVKNKKRQK